MPESAVFFSGDFIARNTALRHDAAALAQAWADATTRFLPVWEAQPLIRDGRAARLSRAELGQRLPPLTGAIYLGMETGGHLFAIALEEREAPRGLGEFGGLRDLVNSVSAADAGLLAYARAMVNWHRHHRHCGVCGAATQAAEGGFVLACSSAGCGHRSFPRLDPAIIVLVHRDQHCLLGRQPSWPTDRFSTIAGFAEPGEALEDAVRREVMEETDVRITQCCYRASQPWPFPASLMIGFHAMATSSDIRLNDGELAEARWFSREELAAGAVVLPPRASVAWRLIEDWFDAVPGPGLAQLHRDGEFLRRPDQPPEAR